MERCPICGLMCAERNHYDGLLYCYNRSCDYVDHGKIQNNINELLSKKVIQNENSISNGKNI